MNRQYIICRYTNSNHRGLFLSLPIAEVYKFVKEDEDELHFLIEGYANKETFYFNLTYTLSSFTFKNPFNTPVDDILLTASCNGIKYFLYAVVNADTNNIDFYDAYYYLYTKWDGDFVSSVVEPFTLTAIYGNENTKYEQRDTSKIMLDIDSYTKIIKGIIFSNDCLFSNLNQIIITDSNFSFNLDFIGQYQYIDNKIQKLNYQHPRVQELFNIKEQLQQLREIDNAIHPIIVNKKIFQEKQNALQVQENVSKQKLTRNSLFKNLEQQLNNIDTIVYQEFLNEKNSFVQLHSFKNYSALCLLIKDENIYLPEWLEHHHNIGIDHFYIYDNNSKKPILDTLKEYKNGFFVNKSTVIPWIGTFKHMQHECYEHCLHNFGSASRWIGFIDTDEFIIIDRNVNQLLQEYEEDFCLWFPWELYNSNDHIKNPHLPQMEAYTKTITNCFGIYGKVFLQPHRTKKMYVHLAEPLHPFDKVVNNTHIKHYDSLPDLNRQYYKGQQGKMFDIIKCNHYITRSFEEWYEKITRGSCDPSFVRKFYTYFDYNPELKYLLNDPEIQKLINTQQPYYG